MPRQYRRVSLNNDQRFILDVIGFNVCFEHAIYLYIFDVLVFDIKNTRISLYVVHTVCISTNINMITFTLTTYSLVNSMIKTRSLECIYECQNIFWSVSNDFISKITNFIIVLLVWLFLLNNCKNKWHIDLPIPLFLWTCVLHFLKVYMSDGFT